MADLTVTRDIAAPSASLWTLVADLTRMGEWSTENMGGSWVKGATGPALGAKFKGANAHGSKKWTTMATITSCEPGKSFGFRVAVGPIKVADWHYDFEDRGNGVTRVTETWTEQRPGLIQKLGKTASGVADRRASNKASMEETLRRIEEFVLKSTKTP